VSRSKRLCGSLTRPQFDRATLWWPSLHQLHLLQPFISRSWLRMYCRITASSQPTVDTKYPRAQKCCPTKFRFRSP